MSEKPVIDPNPQTLPDILASLPDDTPIVMLNLLRFNETARYKDGEADYSGREAYQKYSDVAFGKVRGVGGELVWKGKALAGVIAPDAEKSPNTAPPPCRKRGWWPCRKNEKQLIIEN